MIFEIVPSIPLETTEIMAISIQKNVFKGFHVEFWLKTVIFLVRASPSLEYSTSSLISLSSQSEISSMLPAWSKVALMERDTSLKSLKFWISVGLGLAQS